MHTPERPLLIFGARGFAQEVADLAGDTPGVRVAGYVENYDRELCGERDGLPVLWIDDVARMAGTHSAICGLGTTRRRALIEQVAAMGFEFIALIHPSARVSSKSSIGPGAIVSAGAIIAAHSRIGAHVIVNRGALLGHHLEIGACSTIGPGANIGGGCRLGEGVYIGIGATIVDHLNIGRGSVVGAGAVVTRDLPERVLAVGVPAKVVKEGIEGK
ncbi:MAG: acetyltransferase [Bryobacteraceae bacterium]